VLSPRCSPAKAGAYRTGGNAAEILRGYTLSMEKIRIEQHSFMGIVWFGAWLFTIGFLRLTFWKGVLAIVLWPYYLGLMFSSAGR